jgi:ketosteroid isomerase-like protein
VLALETIWNDAHVRGDADALEALWADDLVVTVSRMAVLSREASVAMVRLGRITFTRYETSQTRAHLYGDRRRHW